MTADPFDTAARRDAVLQSWALSHTRFREDANAEEDLVLGGYADRLLVELAQNAADAASRAGVPGRLRFRLEPGPVLVASNTGAPLDNGGVDGLTSLRASAKREGDTVGRFGVGFAAVLSVSDEPEVRSTHGGVRFSATRTREEVAALGGEAAAEAARRDGQVPVLRLSWPCDAPPSDGFDTEVRLPLRQASPAASGRSGAEPAVKRPEGSDTAAVERPEGSGTEAHVRELLDAFDPALLLALPALTSVEIGDRLVERRDAGDSDVLLTDDGVTTRWRCVRAGGSLPVALLADRPVEERSQTSWWVLCAAPVDDAGRLVALPGDQVVHAPTPSTEPLSLPVRLAASFPLEPARRRVAAGPLTEFLVARVASAVAELAGAVAPDPSALALVPRPTLARAELDAQLCSAVLAALADTPLLPPAFVDPELDGKEPERLIGRRAVVAEPVLAPAVELLAEVVPGLLPASYSTDRAVRAALDALGTRPLRLPEAVDAVVSVVREPFWWRALYAALAEAATGLAEADALAGLPVPLADGRTVTGPRGLLLPDEDLPAAAVTALGLRVVHPDALHPLLERLGAQPATPRGLLADERVRAEAAHSLDAEDPGPVADALMALVVAAGVAAGEEPWLAELALPGDDDEWYPAGELLVPGAPLESVLTEDAPFGVVDAEFAERWGAEALLAVGCLRTFETLDEPDVDLADIEDLHLDAADEWADEVYDAVEAFGASAASVRIERLRGIRDLELVDAARWPEALALIAQEPLRSVLAAPAYALTGDGQRIEVPSYPRWWLGSHPVLAGRLPTELRTPDAAALDGLFDIAEGSDQELLALLGCRGGLADLLDAVRADPHTAGALFARLADEGRTVTPTLLREVYPRLAEALSGASVPPPDRIRVAPDRVVAAEQAVVLDAPWHVDALGDRFPVPAGSDPEAVADLLDIPVLSELVARS